MAQYTPSSPDAGRYFSFELDTLPTVLSRLRVRLFANLCPTTNPTATYPIISPNDFPFQSFTTTGGLKKEFLVTAPSPGCFYITAQLSQAMGNEEYVVTNQMAIDVRLVLPFIAHASASDFTHL